VGAGTGATAGKVLGRENASRGGAGVAAESHSGHSLLALAVVNPVGDVLDAQGRIIAGARGPDGTFAGGAGVVRAANPPGFGPAAPPVPRTNTTLAAIVTDAPLPREALAIVARMAVAALARRISPAFTPFDGDMIFALSTASEAGAVTSPDVMAWGTVACAALESAIERAVTAR
jgi:L-aminopeptidase/D-esterase-like protein